MLIEASIQDLIRSTEQIDTTARHHIAYQVQMVNGYQVVKFGPDLVFQGQTSTNHHPKIRMVGYQLDEGPRSAKVVTVSGEELSIKPLSKRSKTYITCDCEDFIYRFAMTNQKQDVLFGRITSVYIPKTNRPSSNIGQIGVCKHIIRLIDLLEDERIVRY